MSVFESYVAAGRSADQVATDLGITIDRVYQAKSRMLKRLEQVIASQVEEEG
jgi:hypothetical protein